MRAAASKSIRPRAAPIAACSSFGAKANFFGAPNAAHFDVGGFVLAVGDGGVGGVGQDGEQRVELGGFGALLLLEARGVVLEGRDLGHEVGGVELLRLGGADLLGEAVALALQLLQACLQVAAGLVEGLHQLRTRRLVAAAEGGVELVVGIVHGQRSRVGIDPRDEALGRALAVVVRVDELPVVARSPLGEFGAQRVLHVAVSDVLRLHLREAGLVERDERVQTDLLGLGPPDPVGAVVELVLRGLAPLGVRVGRGDGLL